jgi:hypothetical protein
MEARRIRDAALGAQPRGTSPGRALRGATVWPAVALVITATVALLPSATAVAAGPPVSASISPQTGRADLASSYAETYKANATLQNGTIRTVIPSGWTLPQTSNPGGAGYVVASAGTCTSVGATPSLTALAGGGTQVTLTAVSCAVGAHLTLGYQQADARKAGTYTFGPTSVQTSASAGRASIASPAVKVTAGPTTQFVLNASSHTTTAGATYAFTVTPEDAGGDVSGYSGTVAFASSDTGPATVLPAPTTIGGAHTFSAKLTTAGVQSITATDTTVPTITGTLAAITVHPAATALLGWSAVAPVQTTPAGQFPVGSAVSFTLSATDKYHNVTPNYGGKVVFTSNTDHNSVLPGAYTFVPSTDQGSHAFRLTPMTVGAQTYTATASLTNSITGSTVVPVSIAVGPETGTDLSGTVGVPFSQTFTATGETGTVTWSANALPPGLSLDSTSGDLSGTPTSAGTFGPFTVTAIDSAAPAHAGSWSYVLEVGDGSQTVSFTSGAPTAPYFEGPTYTPSGTSSSGLPVAFSADPSSSAVCTGTGVITFVGVGTCTVDADQGGNADWLAAPQVQQSFSVDAAPQTVAFTSTAPSDAVVGGATYMADATSTSTSTGLPTNLDVTLSIDPGSSSVCSISGGLVSFTGIGTCTIDATQAGDDDYLAATEAQQIFTVSGAPQTISFTSIQPANAVVGGLTYAPTASATSGESVTLTIDTLASSVCSIDAGGNVSFSGVGVCIIDANQSGDDTTWAAAPQVQQTFDVGQGSETIEFTSTAPGDAVVGGTSYSPSASDTSGPPPAEDPLTLSIDPSAASVCTMAADGTVSFTGIGTCTIDANQAGNADYLPSAEVQQSFTVAGAPQTITFNTPAPSDVHTGTTYTPAASTTATDGSAVALTIDGASSSVCTIAPDGTVSFVATGTCTVDANQGGDSTYAPAAQVQQSVVVSGLATQTISFTSAAPTGADVGSTPYYVPTATSTATATDPALQVALTVDPAATSVCSINHDGTMTFTAAGTCRVDANQNGDANYLPAPQVQQSFIVRTPLGAVPLINVDPTGDAQTVVTPPNPGVNVCQAQQFPDGGCAINDLDGTIDDTFDATATSDPNPDPSHDTVTYYWKIFFPPIFGPGVIFSDRGITGYHSPVLQIAAGSLPELASDLRTAGDPFWRAELTTTVNGRTTTSVFFRFIYDSTINLDFSTDCLISGYFAGFDCSVVGPQLLQLPVIFTSTPPTDAVVGGPAYTPSGTIEIGGPVMFWIDSSSTSVCSLAADNRVTFIGAGTCTIDADQSRTPPVVPAETKQSFQVGA